MDFERNIEDARSVCRDLQAIIDQQGNLSDETLEEVERLCVIARLIIDDIYCRRLLGRVERYAERLASGDVGVWVQGFEDVSGDVCMRHLIFTLLKVIDQRLGSEALHRRSASARLRASSIRRSARQACLATPVRA